MTVEKVKVYELAKELGVDSMTLLEKLKQLDIDVKSHMSSLGTEEVKAVREQLAKEQALLSKVAKATKATKTAKKKLEEEPVVQKRVGATVIRRRAKSAGDETGAPQTSGSEQVEAADQSRMQAEAAPQMPEEIQAPEVFEEQPVEAEVTEAEAEVAPAATAAPTATPSARVETPTVAPTAPKVAPMQGSGLKFPSLLGSRSEGITPRNTGSILNIIKEEPKKAVAPRVMPNVRPNIPGQPPQVMPRGTTSGIVNLGKEAIDRMVEEEQAGFKKKTGAGRSERDKQPADVKVADYRAKKELIFLPKKKKVPGNKEIHRTAITTPAAHKRIIKMENSVTVSALAERMGVKAGEIIKKLIGMGVMATLNHTLDHDTAVLLATDYGYEVENVAYKEEAVISKSEDKAEDLQPRPPIVTVMGHVDHGKTSLLDAIRSANVAAGEAGGITQAIGAYTVDINGQKITFIDTPGHEAFTVMRARGANVTDIVILVVAADDGVMPQTREAVDHAKAANVPIIVAVNKIDKPGANPEKVMKGLSELGLLSEAWGGENIFVNVSATKKTGIKELLESVLLQAEILDLKANPNRLAEGTVLEARLDRNRGPLVDIIVKKGSLKVGDPIVVGTFSGKVRALMDDKGRSMKVIGPGYAAELLGLEGVPTSGDLINAMASDSEARELADHRINKTRAAGDARSSKMSLDDLFSKVQQGELKELPVVLKTDAFGSTEAIRDSLQKIATEKVKVKVISASSGGVSESDVMLASASNAIILAFNVRPETKARALAESEKVEIKAYSIIYELLEDVKKAMAGLLDKKAVEKYLGRAEVRELFSVPKIGVIAGSFVVDGKINRGAQVRLLRDNRVVFTGKLSSLRRFKDDAKEVAQGYECGIGIDGYNDLKVGDIIEAFMVEMIAQELGEATGGQTKEKATPQEAARV